MPKRLVLVGAGTGGTFAANLLAMKLKKEMSTGEVQITLMGEGFRHYFQPANLDIAFRGATTDAFSRSELDLLRPGIRFIPDPAAKVDLEDRRVTSVGGTEYDYDELLLATGAEAAPDMVPGLK